jgi:hypothetical protein
MKNKLLITIDGIRKDRIGIYNSKAEYLTPNLTKIGRMSVVFDDMVAAATSTGMCFSSIFTGKNQKDFGRKTYGDTQNPFLDNLFTDHEKLGYKTIICLNNRFDIHHRLINAFGSAEHWWTGNKSSSDNKNYGSLRPVEQIQYLIDKLSNIDQPVLVWMHLWGFGGPQASFLERTSFDYDARVSELDEAIGLIFDHYHHNSELFFFSDHGYSFFEHGNWGYGKQGSNLSESVCNIPMIAYNGKSKGVNKNLVSQIRMREIVLNSNNNLRLSDDIAFCESRYSNQGDMALAIRKGKFKLVYNYYERQSKFYDLHTDPYENIDMASNRFYKLTRDDSGHHPSLTPYIIRADWPLINQAHSDMLSIAQSYYGDCNYGISVRGKEWVKRQKFLTVFISLYLKHIRPILYNRDKL